VTRSAGRLGQEARADSSDPVRVVIHRQSIKCASDSPGLQHILPASMSGMSPTPSRSRTSLNGVQRWQAEIRSRFLRWEDHHFTRDGRPEPYQRYALIYGRPAGEATTIEIIYSVSQ
jgi:hypothetical protein